MSISSFPREYRVLNHNGFEGLTLMEVPLPKPKSNEVLVKVHAVSLQFCDLMLAKGIYPLTAKKDVIPGSDMAGEVMEVGEDVKNWKKGDRVCANFSLDHIYGDTSPATQAGFLGGGVDGVLTEYRTFPAHSLVHLPKHLSYEEGSTLPCSGLTAYNCFNGPVPIKAGDTVLVQGTGGVSMFALQFAVVSGAVVIVTSSSDKKLEFAAKLGAKHCINYKKTPHWDEEVLKITNGRGVDHVVEVGGSGTIAKSINAVRYGGYIYAVGFLTEEATNVDIISKSITKAITLRGVMIGSVSQFEQMNSLIATAEIRPVVDKVFPFENLVKAYEYYESQAHVGKVVVKVSKD